MHGHWSIELSTLVNLSIHLSIQTYIWLAIPLWGCDVVIGWVEGEKSVPSKNIEILQVHKSTTCGLGISYVRTRSASRTSACLVACPRVFLARTQRVSSHTFGTGSRRSICSMLSLEPWPSRFRPGSSYSPLILLAVSRILKRLACDIA